jgi:transcriptional regulator with XRE-family HTH domain
MGNRNLEEEADVGRGLAVLRTALDLPQAEVARLAGVPPSAISEYESGGRKPRPKTLRQILSALRVSPATLERARALIREIPAGPGTSAEEAGLETLGDRTRRLVRARFTRTSAPKPAPVSKSEDRKKVPVLWERLQPLLPEQRLALIEEDPEFQGWALCEFLAHESGRQARSDAQTAVDLAELAIHVARLAPGTRSWRCRLEGYGGIFLGNAKRALGSLPAAEEEFRRAEDLWRRGSPHDPDLLEGTRFLDLRASLLRGQRRLNEALELLGRALVEGPKRAAARARIHILRAKTLEEMDDYEGAIQTLGDAGPLLEEDPDPVLRFSYAFNLSENLFQVGRLHEAQPLLAEVKDLAEQLDNDLDRVRLRWLEGRIAAGLGRRDEAIDAFTQVKDAFAARGIAYDVALVSLELAVLLLERGDAAEVETLALEMIAIFEAQNVHREALAALQLFHRAVEQRTVTADLARRLAGYLRKAQFETGLRFEE